MFLKLAMQNRGAAFSISVLRIGLGRLPLPKVDALLFKVDIRVRNG